jgi:alpha-beta hydrolase superfamily lysophospholipase
LVTLKLYGGGYHEIFNDLDRAQVVKDALEWMEGLLRGR